MVQVSRDHWLLHLSQLLGWFVYVLRKHLKYKLFSWIR